MILDCELRFANSVDETFYAISIWIIFHKFSLWTSRNEETTVNWTKRRHIDNLSSRLNQFFRIACDCMESFIWFDGEKLKFYIRMQDYTYRLHIQLAKLLRILNSNWISNLLNTFCLFFFSSVWWNQRWYCSNWKCCKWRSILFFFHTTCLCQFHNLCSCPVGPHNFLGFTSDINKRINCPIDSGEYVESFWNEQCLV